MSAPRPHNEADRQAALDAYKILDTEPEEAFDDLALIAGAICGRPMSAVTLIDHDRQWLKAEHGVGAKQTPREHAFCAHTILEPEHVMIVEDTHIDPRFQKNPYVLDAPQLRFYVGAPLVTQSGHALGSLCVMDQKPGQLTHDQEIALKALARQVVQLLELKRVSGKLEDMVIEQAWYEDRLKEENATLILQVSTDPLTGIGNRRAFREGQENIVAASQNAWIALVDIDHFKTINDTHGHPKGDEVLVELAGRLRKAALPGHVVARLGGEEFAWLMPQTSESEAMKIADEFRQEIQAMQEPLPCTISIGLAFWNYMDDSEEALRRADEALYIAKRSGRNRVECATGS